MTDSLTGPLTDMADRADMADRTNSRIILPPMAYIDGKSEIISHWPTDWPTGPLTALTTRRCYRI